MIEGIVIITNETGIHARPASQIVGFLSKYTNTEINFIKDNKKANAKSLLNILTLGLEKDSEITVTVNGENEEATLNAVIEFVGNLKD